jgi:hypothetical protein
MGWWCGRKGDLISEKSMDEWTVSGSQQLIWTAIYGANHGPSQENGVGMADLFDGGVQASLTMAYHCHHPADYMDGSKTRWEWPDADY